MSAVRTHLCTDADNTLWDTDGVFAAAQLAMLREVEFATGLTAPDAEDRGLEFLRRIDQRIAATHPERLRYPPDLLVRGLVHALAGEEAGEAANRATQGHSTIPGEEIAVQHFRAHLRAIPPLRPGVERAIPIIAEAGVPIIVVTEERLPRCRQILDVHGLLARISEVISVQKSANAFRDLQRKLGKGRILMVGDQLDRDIKFAHEAGFETVYLPSDFVPYWNRELAVTADHRIASFDEVIPLVLGDRKIVDGWPR